MAGAEGTGGGWCEGPRGWLALALRGLRGAEGVERVVGAEGAEGGWRWR